MSKSTFVRQARADRLAPCLLALAVLSGCGDTPAPEAADEGQARRVLEEALAGWSRGETVEGMKGASPPVTVSDPRWARGDSLQAFEVLGDGKPSAAERLFTVKLTLKDGQGKEITETVDYRVGTDPVRTVFRSVF